MKSIKNFYKILRSEFSTQINFSKLLIIFCSILLPLLIVFLGENMVTRWEQQQTIPGDKKEFLNKSEFIISETKKMFGGPLLIQGITYALFLRLIFVFKDSNTIDKNRLSFLRYSKNTVSFSKIFVDISLLIFHIFVLMFAGILVIKFYLKGEFNSDIYIDAFKIGASVIVIYLFSAYGVKFINSFFDENKFKKIILGVWILCTFAYYLLLTPILGLSEVKTFYKENISWIIYAPFLNLILPALQLQGVVEVGFLELLPLLSYTFAFIFGSWRLFARKNKEFLCI